MKTIRRFAFHAFAPAIACASFSAVSILVSSLTPYCLSASAQDLLESLGSTSNTRGTEEPIAEDSIAQRESELKDIEAQLLRKMNAVTTSEASSASPSSVPAPPRKRITTPAVRTATYTAPVSDETPGFDDSDTPTERQPSHSVSVPQSSANTSMEQKLAIAESQVTILSRELETSRRGLRSAERRIQELSDLVQSGGPKPKQSPPSDLTYTSEGDVPRGIRSGHLAPLVEEEEEAYAPTIRARTSLSATISATKAPVRTGPSKSESMLFLLPQHSQVTIDRRTGEWYRVVTDTGARGWISGQSLLFDTGVSASSAVQVHGVRMKYEPTHIRY